MRRLALLPLALWVAAMCAFSVKVVGIVASSYNPDGWLAGFTVGAALLFMFARLTLDGVRWCLDD